MEHHCDLIKFWKACGKPQDRKQVKGRPMRRKKTVTVICGQYVFLENSKESTKGILNDEFSRLN